MAKNLTQQGFPSSTEGMKPKPFISRSVNVADGTASAKRTEAVGEPLQMEFDDLRGDIHPEDYINAVLSKVKSPFNVSGWNERASYNVPYMDWKHKGMSVNSGDNRVLYLNKFKDLAKPGTQYTAAVDNVYNLVGDDTRNKTFYSPVGNLNLWTEDGMAGVDFETPSYAQQMYYVNALKNLLGSK